MSATPADRVIAVMSMPRLAFTDNMFCAWAMAASLGIRCERFTGAYWGQCLERALELHADEAGYDYALCVDYDSVFQPADVVKLVRIMDAHADLDAVFPVQIQRCNGMVMCVPAKPGLPDTDDFNGDLTRCAIGHFGLTVLRLSALRDIPHPWFWAQPNAADGRWYGHLDDDAYFWKKWYDAGKSAHQANRVVIGHSQLVITWPTQTGEAVHQYSSDYWQTGGTPAGVWQ